MTATQIITRALRLIGRVKGPGQGAATEELTEGLAAVNAMLANWSTERLNVYSIQTLALTLISTQSTYTIGPSAADFNQARPLKIESASAAAPSPAGTGKIHSPLDLLNVKQWASIEFRDSAVADLPTALYYDSAFPIATFSVFPAFVSSATTTLELGVWTQLASFADLVTGQAFPPGYDQAIIYGLALELAPTYGVAPSPAVVQIANESKAAIRSLNATLEAPGAPSPTAADPNAIAPKLQQEG